MTDYNTVEEFRKETQEKPQEFSFLGDFQEKTFETLKNIIEINIINRNSRRFSMIIFGSPGIGKSFVMNCVMKKLESEEKISSEDYLLCKNFKEEVIKEHHRHLYKYYNNKTINNLVERLLKRYLEERDLKLIIFDDLKEREFLSIDFSASGFRYNSNGKGVIWILSFKEGFESKIDKSNIELLEIPDIKRNNLQHLIDRHFRDLNISLESHIKNINDLLKHIKKNQDQEEKNDY